MVAFMLFCLIGMKTNYFIIRRTEAELFRDPAL